MVLGVMVSHLIMIYAVMLAEPSGVGKCERCSKDSRMDLLQEAHLLIRGKIWHIDWRNDEMTDASKRKQIYDIEDRNSLVIRWID